MEAFFRTHSNLVEHTDAQVRRTLMDEIDWTDRMIGIKGTRGVGKTTFLLQYAKERFGKDNRQCLYLNMNNFYFQSQGIADFARMFVGQGGRTLLVDQVFKQPDWSRELRRCHDELPQLRIVFTGSSVMRLREDPELRGVARSYNLRGFSFREFLNLRTGESFRPYALDELLSDHEGIARRVTERTSPLSHFRDYLHHGFYPLFLEHRNYSENLLKTMNMMIEVDILLIGQIDLKYLTKIKQLFYLLAVEGVHSPNISLLANKIDTSRATVMNYIKYLADARLINMVHGEGQQFPKKPARVLLQNPNLTHAIYPIAADEQDEMETFFVNALWKDHVVSVAGRAHAYVVDGRREFRVCDARGQGRLRPGAEAVHARYDIETGHDNHIPLWLLGFLY